MDVSSERAYPTPLFNSTLLPLLLLSLAKQKNAPTRSKPIQKEYDYIIVGAGSAGSVVASRLSELSCVRVLLLEAGKAPPLLNDVPALGRDFWFTDVDWAFKTVPQKHTGSGLINRQLIWPSGKALGGSSVLNAMLYVRGNKKNYDDWEAHGAKGWSSKDVWPYFLKLEDNQDPEFLANGGHTVGGPVTVQQPRYEAEIKRPLFRTAQQMGYKIVDSNGRRQTGFYDLQGTLRNGQRCSTAKAYLVPAENRKNLDIVPNAFVRKVVIKERRATGVIFDFEGKKYEVRVRREVIMSAGTTNTAQLLMLSGIGPRKHLEQLNIPVITDLPVGDNFHDHAGPTVNFELDPRIPLISEKISNSSNIARYIKNRTGPLASAEGVAAVAFLNGLSVSSTVDFPKYEMYFEELVTDIPRQQLGLKPEVYQQVYGPYENKPFYTCFVHLLQPKSRGTVRLQSKNPYDPPLIDPNYLADPRDVQDLVEGMKICQRIGTSEPMRKVGSKPFKTLYPGCEHFAEDEDRYFECQARSVISTLSHQVGTAKMGDPKDPTTVVDPELRVKGIQGLRVVDASVMPIVPSGNTNVPTIMVAEKASDIIKATISCHWHVLTEHNSMHIYETEEPEDESDHSRSIYYENTGLETPSTSSGDTSMYNLDLESQDEYFGPDVEIHSMEKVKHSDQNLWENAQSEVSGPYYNRKLEFADQWISPLEFRQSPYFLDIKKIPSNFRNDKEIP